jgi:predicted sulfurtransferase
MKIILSILMTACLAIGLACQAAKTEPAKTAESVKNEPAKPAKVETGSSTVADDGTSVGADGANRITLDGTKKLFDAGNVLIVDTRAKSAYDTEHIKGAINVSAGDLEARLKDLKTDKKIVAYCS